MLIDPSEQPIEHKKLQEHPLYGVKGWALVLPWWLIASSILGLVLTYSNWYVIKELSPRAFIRLENNYTFDLFGAWLIFAWSCANALWLSNKNDIFRMSFFAQLLSVIFLLVVSSIALGEALGGGIAPSGLLAASLKALVFLVPLVYVFRSRRISVTCDSMLRHDDPFFARHHTNEHQDPKDKPLSRMRGVVDRFALKTEPRPTNDDTKLYAQAWEELESSERDNGLWAKAFADSEGDDDKTKALYIKFRVEQIKEQQEEQVSEEARKEAERDLVSKKIRQEREAQEAIVRNIVDKKIQQDREKEAETVNAEVTEVRDDGEDSLPEHEEKVESRESVAQRDVGATRPIVGTQKGYPKKAAVVIFVVVAVAGLLVYGINLKPKNDIELGRYYQKKGDRDRAKKIYEKVASRGVAEAQYLLGQLHLSNNKSESVRWYAKAGEQGHGKAQKRLGEIYAFGEFGFKRDVAIARYWFHKIVDEKHLKFSGVLYKWELAKATYRLGWLYDHFDDPVMQDSYEKERAQKYYAMARTKYGYKIESYPYEVSFLEKNLLSGYEGIGVTFIGDSSTYQIDKIVDGSPAQKVGLQKGDEVLAVDGTPVADVPRASVFETIRGKSGTKVRLTLKRKGVHNQFTVTLERAFIRTK